MTKQEFLQCKLSSFKPQFKELIGLVESDKTSHLIDFMTKLHPNQAKISSGSKGEVFGNKYYTFIIFKTGILKTTVETGCKRFFPYNN